MAESGSGEQGSSALPEGVPAHPPTSFGVYYPEHDVVAIIDDQSDTSKAIEALIAAGIPAGHVHQLDKKLVLERDHNLRENPSLGARVARLVSFVMSDTGQYQQDYADEVAKGHNMLLIQEPNPDELDRLKDILAEHHAHLARYYGSRAITDLIA